MPLSVDLFILPIVTVLATLRSQVTNLFRSRAIPRPVRDLTVGTPVEFDDLTSESNKQEVRQHDYYDRRKETLNTKQRKYEVAADVPDNVPKDQYTNEALETMFSQAFEVGKGLESIFAKKDRNDTSGNDPTSHEQKSSKVDEPKDTFGGDSKDDNEKDAAVEPADKLMLPREAEARELYKLYEMPPKPLKNKDQISVTSTDSLDPQCRLPWRQWISYLRSKTFSFGLRNLFRRHAKTYKEKPKVGTAGKEAGKTGSDHEKPKDGSADQISVASTDSMHSQVRLPWRHWINYFRSKTFSFGLRNLFRRHAKTCKEKPKAGKAGKEACRTGSGKSTVDSSENKAEESTCDKTKFKNALRKLVNKRSRQQKLSVEQINATTKDDKTNNVLTENNQKKIQTKPLITPANMYGQSTMTLPKCAWGHDDCDYMQQKMKLLGSSASRDHGQPSHSVEPIQRITKPRSHGTIAPVPTQRKPRKIKGWLGSLRGLRKQVRSQT